MADRLDCQKSLRITYFDDNASVQGFDPGYALIDKGYSVLAATEAGGALSNILVIQYGE